MTYLYPLLDHYEAYLQLERGLSANTRLGYRSDAEKLARYLGDNEISIEDVTTNTLREFINLLFELGISSRSQARVVAGLRSLFRYLRMERYVEFDPAQQLDSPKIGHHLPQVLSIEEIDAMEAAIDRTKAEASRNLAIIETLYSCGMRVSELVNLEIDRVMMDEMYIMVIGKGNKERLVPLSPSAADAIREYLPHRAALPVKPGNGHYLFLNRRGAKLTRVMIFYIIRELARLAGIRKTISPHTLRHSFATHLLQGGANLRAIQQMLGHESIATTEIYIHLDRSHLRREILEHHPRNQRRTN